MLIAGSLIAITTFLLLAVRFLKAGHIEAAVCSLLVPLAVILLLCKVFVF